MVVRSLIARAAVRGDKWVRAFLFVVGILALAGGAVAATSLDSKSLSPQFCIALIVSGVFNMSMGIVLGTSSALEWTK